MLQVSPVRAFADNYIWMIHSPRDRSIVVAVDPGDAAPVKAELQRRHWSLGAVLVTHHHHDHVGGVAALVDAFSIPVFGPAREAVALSSQKLVEGDSAMLPELGLHFDVIDIPGHTAGHIAYTGHGAMFCGDTLFSAGCGRMFEGTPQQMIASLDKLGRLPGTTEVFCGHEYTLGNLSFAKAVEPDNVAVERHIGVCTELKGKGEPTVPSTLELEHAINPFLRCDTQTVKRAAEAHAGRTLDNRIDVFAVVREWKNGFRG